MKKKSVKSRFKSDIKDHKMEIVKDDGSFRHVRFSRPDSLSYSFELTTWPGYLTISGDMGCWVFCRTPDMFEFFRSDKLTINNGYWSEKLQSSSKYEGPEQQFSIDAIRDSIKHHLKGCYLTPKIRKAIMRQVEDDVLSMDSEHDIWTALRDFEYSYSDGSEFNTKEFTFQDIWELHSTEWSFHYEWCCYAIVWGIQQYDKHQKKIEKQNAKAVAKINKTLQQSSTIDGICIGTS